jgi:hypothetical protein
MTSFWGHAHMFDESDKKKWGSREPRLYWMRLPVKLHNNFAMGDLLAKDSCSRVYSQSFVVDDPRDRLDATLKLYKQMEKWCNGKRYCRRMLPLGETGDD